MNPQDDEMMVDALVMSATATVAVIYRLAAEHELSLTQVRVFGILRDRHRGRMTGLAQRLGLDTSTLSVLVARAEKRGWLQRLPAEDDRRAVDVVLTAAGAELAERLHRELNTALMPTTERLSATERRRLHLLLRKSLGEPPGT
jgi:DNA-binding MarR family transcriptional regulator